MFSAALAPGRGLVVHVTRGGQIAATDVRLAGRRLLWFGHGTPRFSERDAHPAPVRFEYCNVMKAALAFGQAMATFALAAIAEELGCSAGHLPGRSEIAHQLPLRVGLLRGRHNIHASTPCADK